MLTHRTIDSPLGPLTLYASDNGVRHLVFSARESHPAWESTYREDAAEDAVAQLRAYFAGELTTFTCLVDVPGTGFHRTAQRLLTRIPYATTINYTDLAAKAGNPRAVRAAGSACARNPVPLLWPCHRVIRTDGTWGAYRGGADAKAWLLEHERGNLAGARTV